MQIIGDKQMNFLQIFTEQDGQFSSRRTAALFCVLFSAFLSVYTITYKEIVNWYIFIPVALFLAVALILWFFTTWADIKEVASLFSKKNTAE